ncbi:MAG: methyltransferase domain-containing protein [Alphaproteobacteria bacterium]
MSSRSQAVEKAEEYYDSSAADSFYRNVWGGEDIHIGLYRSPDEAIAPASRRTVSTMAERIAGLGPDSHVIDLGAGYGGSARYLAETHGCRVTCLNLSTTQNAINEEKNAEAGLTDRIDVLHGSFEDVPAEDARFDVVWSQDSILHSGDRPLVLDEIRRVLKPGGQFIFTDPMQSDDCPPGVLQPILDRIHLETLGSIAFYRKALGERGFEEVAVLPMLDQLRTHYTRVGEDLKSRYDEIITLSGHEYVDNMLQGLDRWVEGADSGYLAWGILHFRKT